MNDATSRCVTLLRFPLILLVLYIHSFIAPLHYHGATLALAPAPWLLVVQTAWSNGFARTAVPLFFLMSGYLYFLGFDGSLAAYRIKTRRRVSTLLVPYLFWNLLVFALFAAGEAIPATAAYFSASNARLVDLSPFDMVDAVLGLTHFPIAYPFWFIRDLMLIALAAPLIHWLVTQIGVAVPLVLLGWWALKLPFVTMPSIEAVTYFVIGAWLAAHGRALFAPARWLRWVVPLYLALLAGDVTLRSQHVPVGALYPVAVAVGVVAVLALTSWVEQHAAKLSARLIALSAASFFVFAAHEPLMTLLRKLLYRALGPSQATIFACYAVLPLLLAGALVLVYLALRRVAPRFTALISGGR